MATSSLCNFLPFLSSSSQLPLQTKKLPNQFVPRCLSSDSFPTLSSSTSHRNRDEVSSVMAEDLTSVVCPSLANANILYSKSDSFNVHVVVGEEEPVEELIRRFRREVMRAGIIQETRRRRYFENSQEKRKRKIKDAAKRNKRRRTPFRPREDSLEDVKAVKKTDNDGDNWDIPSGGLS